MYANTVKKLSLLAIVGLCFWCPSASATLVHYWPFDNPSPLADEGLPYVATITGINQTWYPHAAQLVDPAAGYVAPTLVPGRFGDGYGTPTTQPPYSDILIGGNNVANSTAVDGTFPPPPMTLSIWFYPTYPSPSLGDLDYIIGNYSTSNNNDRLYLSYNWPNVTPAPTAGRFCFSWANQKDAGKNIATGAGYHPVTIGAWHHAFMTIVATSPTAATVSLVTDGDYTNPLTVTGIAPYGPAPWCADRGNKRIGTNGNQIETGKTAIGIFDDCAIWNEALPLSQAAFIWNNGAGRRANVADGRRGYDPTPANKSVGNSGVTQLKWYNAQLLTSNVTCDVYMSTNSADLIDPCNVPLFPVANKVATAVAGTAGAQSTITPAIPVSDTIYWMVSTKTTNPADGNNVNGYAGPVWKFDLSNAVPQADAGSDKYTYAAAGTIVLSGVVTDDGLPGGATVTCTWKQGSTPITTNVVKVGNTYTCTATVAVGASGTTTTYTLEGNDTTGTGSDTMDVKVYDTPCHAAQADPGYLKNAADINDDCFVNFKDFALTVNKWKTCTALDAICN